MGVAVLGARTGTGAAMVVVSDGGRRIGLWYRLVQVAAAGVDLARRRREERAFIFPQDSLCAWQSYLLHVRLVDSLCLPVAWSCCFRVADLSGCCLPTPISRLVLRLRINILPQHFLSSGLFYLLMVDGKRISQ